MKIRITAMILSVAMLAVLLTGCACEHEWAEATCVAPKTCNLCQATEGEALGHSWAEVTCAAPKTCTACGETEGEALPHTWVDATYQAPKTCTECGTTEGEPLLTLFDELGLKVWRGFKTSSDIYSWAYEKEFIHTEGHAKNLKTASIYAIIQIGNYKEKVNTLVDTAVDVVIHENTHLEYEMDLYMDAFRKAYDDEVGTKLTDEAWNAICADYKILDVEMTQELDLAPYFKEALKSNLRWSYSLRSNIHPIMLADKYSGDLLIATANNRFYEDVGVIHIDHQGEKIPVMAVCSMSYEDGQLSNGLPRMKVTQNIIVFVPRSYDGVVPGFATYASAQTEEEMDESTDYNEPWALMSLKDDDAFYKEHGYFFATIPPVME